MEDLLLKYAIGNVTLTLYLYLSKLGLRLEKRWKPIYKADFFVGSSASTFLCLAMAVYFMLPS